MHLAVEQALAPLVAFRANRALALLRTGPETNARKAERRQHELVERAIQWVPVQSSYQRACKHEAQIAILHRCARRCRQRRRTHARDDSERTHFIAKIDVRWQARRMCEL